MALRGKVTEVLSAYERLKESDVPSRAMYLSGCVQHAKQLRRFLGQALPRVAAAKKATKNKWCTLLNKVAPVWNQLRVDLAERDTFRLLSWGVLMDKLIPDGQFRKRARRCVDWPGESTDREIIMEEPEPREEPEESALVLSANSPCMKQGGRKRTQGDPPMTGELALLESRISEATSFLDFSPEKGTRFLVGLTRRMCLLQTAMEAAKRRQVETEEVSEELNEMLLEGNIVLEMMNCEKFRYASELNVPLDRFNMSEGTSSITRSDSYADVVKAKAPAKHLFALPAKMVEAMQVRQVELGAIEDREERRYAREEATELLQAVPNFGGDLGDYWQWMEAAADYIAQAYGSEMSKFNLLSKTLTGDAAKIAGSVAMGKVCTLNALVLGLHREYGNRDLSRERTIRELRLLKGPKAGSSSDFRTMARDARRAVLVLEKIGALDDHRGEVYRLIRSKLPRETDVKWVDRGTANDVHGILDFIDDEASKWVSHDAIGEELVEKANPDKSNNSFGDKRGKKKLKYDSVKKSSKMNFATALLTQAKGSCTACGQNCQSLMVCPTFLGLGPNDRNKFVRSNKLHIVCLGTHQGAKCPGIDKRCKLVNCTEKLWHHTLLHGSDLPLWRPKGSERDNQKLAEASTTNATAGTNAPPVVSLCSKRHADDHTLFLVNALVRAKPGGQEIQSTVVLDGGASRSFIDQELAETLGIPLQLSWSEIGLLGGTSRSKSAVVQFQISGDGKTWYDVTFASTKPGMQMRGPKVEWQKWAASRPDFASLGLQDVDYGNIRVLLGGLEFKRVTGPPRDFVDSKCGQYSAMRTLLGWTVSGPLGKTEAGQQAQCALHVASAEPKETEKSEKLAVQGKLVDQFRRFNEVESLGILKDPNPQLSQVEQAELEYLRTNVREVDGRFEVPMLRKFNAASAFNIVPESELNARRRLWSTHKQLARTPGSLEEYQKGISTDLKKGYIRKLSDEEQVEMKSGTHFFLPHFGVRHPDKPEKLRRVLDAAAKSHGTSLNDLLRRGPNNLESLIGVLTRWRVGELAVSADIAEMFSQIKLRKEDQYLTAFLWSAKPDEQPEVYVNTRHVFGAKCSPAIASFCVEEAMQRNVPLLYASIGRSFYMDDHFSSWDDLETLWASSCDLTTGLMKSGFELGKWQSNNRCFLQRMKPEAVSPKNRDLCTGEAELPLTKALGVIWDCQSDSLGFGTRKAEKPVSCIAEVLSCLASCFDPLGFVSPFLFMGKLLLQKFWQDKTKWEDPLTEEEIALWTSFADDIPKVKGLTVPRWFGTRHQDEVEIHVFSDASSTGLGAVAYVKPLGQQALILGAKSRIQNPRKAPTIPKLELQGIVLAVRLAETLTSALAGKLRIKKVHLWTDSEVAYWWVKNVDKRYEIYVANRVYEIRKYLESSDVEVVLRHVPTDMNPADLVSRGLTADELTEKWSFWLHGPVFLDQEETSWPKSPRKQSDVEAVLAPIAMMVTTNWEECDGYTSKPTYLSDKIRERDGSDPNHIYSQEELRLEEVNILKDIQLEGLPKVIEFLRKQEGSVGVYWGSELRGKELFLDEEGVLRLRTRLANARFCNYDEKYPIVLPRKHPYTNLVIRHTHITAEHYGTKATRSKLAARYFVARPNQSVGSVVSRCERCTSRRPKRVVAEQGDLHKNRLRMGTYAFASVGMDHWGPFLLKQGKRWGLLMMCLTTRAVWLELVPQPDAECLQHCITQFCCENGAPQEFYSDNGSAMQGTKSDFEEMLNGRQTELKKWVAWKWEADFKFIPPGSPHWGGSWERMIQEVKRILGLISERLKATSDFEYRTLLKRVQFILNQRPLEIGDDGEVLTPWQILRPSAKRSGGIPFELSNHNSLRRLWDAEQTFWNQWHASYLRFLSSTCPTRQNRRVDLQVGDKVVVKENVGTYKPEFMPGVIREIYPGRDGLVRLTKVQTKNGFFLRPITRLCLAEGPALERYRLKQREVRGHPMPVEDSDSQSQK
jgi:hypothetical protein